MMDWMLDALCREAEDPDRWFPVGSSGPAMVQAAEAKAVCWGCPVREQCLAYALDEGLAWGIFGGYDERERRELKTAVQTTNR
jgi:WhiB family redox-sensing transcriptional regulator